MRRLRAQDERDDAPWHVTATHSGDRTAAGGVYQEVTIELAEVALNVHSIYVVVRTRNSIPLMQVDPEQLEFGHAPMDGDAAPYGAAAPYRGRSVKYRALPCELPVTESTRDTDAAVVARLVRTQKRREYVDRTGVVIEDVIGGWGCQPLPLRIKPFRGAVQQQNTPAKAVQRALEAIQAFLRDEALDEAHSSVYKAAATSPQGVVYHDSPHVTQYADEVSVRNGRPLSPTGGQRRLVRSPSRQLAKAGSVPVGGANGVYDLGLSTPVRFVGRWQNNHPLDVSLLMFGWDNLFLPDTHLDRNREAIEWYAHRTAPHEDSVVWLNGVFHGSFMYLVDSKVRSFDLAG